MAMCVLPVPAGPVQMVTLWDSIFCIKSSWLVLRVTDKRGALFGRGRCFIIGGGHAQLHINQVNILRGAGVEFFQGVGCRLCGFTAHAKLPAASPNIHLICGGDMLYVAVHNTA